MTESRRSLPPGKLPNELLDSLLAQHRIRDPKVLIGPGIGRDSAAIEFGNRVLVIKSDPITFPTSHPAQHLIHINANDIACQGAIPRWILVTALLPQGTTTRDTVAEIFADLTAAATEIGVELIGGHTEITLGLDRPLLIGTMLGETTAARLIDPANARPGDRILMTKTAGIEGTALLATELGPALLEAGRLDAGLIASAAALIEHPGLSVLPEALALAESRAASALHDPTEGGVASAVRELATAAACGALISREAIAVAHETRILADALSFDPLGLLSSGTLLAAVPKDRLADAERALEGIGVPFAWIGKLMPPESGIRLRSGLDEMNMPEFQVDEVARLLAK
jgi:hydrogenase expression/formation protein HypE